MQINMKTGAFLLFLLATVTSLFSDDAFYYQNGILMRKDAYFLEYSIITASTMTYAQVSPERLEKGAYHCKVRTPIRGLILSRVGRLSSYIISTAKADSDGAMTGNYYYSIKFLDKDSNPLEVLFLENGPFKQADIANGVPAILNGRTVRVDAVSYFELKKTLNEIASEILRPPETNP